MNCMTGQNNMNSTTTHVQNLPVDMVDMSSSQVPIVHTQSENSDRNGFIVCQPCQDPEFHDENHENSVRQAMEAVDFLDTIEFNDGQNGHEGNDNVDLDKLEEYLA